MGLDPHYNWVIVLLPGSYSMPYRMQYPGGRMAPPPPYPMPRPPDDEDEMWTRKQQQQSKEMNAALERARNKREEVRQYHLILHKCHQLATKATDSPSLPRHSCACLYWPINVSTSANTVRLLCFYLVLMNEKDVHVHF